ncbi:hypothetical protein F4556_005511 [Kitasatospora gansuensis]|uniref:Uncharacterized protein n=1 Tax=Kitasatospora gansuensis TaxID=258050 RepID=A0A7W7SIL6_9ACTN|nr:DUF6454 family protein [Kitasatospora gansuensis]MBB4949976.1 hypothetical protein [Kitasatospora gansuensis]
MALGVNAAIGRLTRANSWDVVAKIPIGFTCHHPQGLDRVGETFYLSGVQILEPTTRLDPPVDGLDRTAGRGRGFLFELTPDGQLLREWELGEGDMYHVGGIAWDGEALWVPVAEYRPGSHSVMYRVDPVSSTVTEMFRYPEHLGGVSRDPATGLLHAITWGGRRVLVLTERGELVREMPMRSHYVDFQDCVEVEDGLVSWTGVAEYPDGAGRVFGLGGIALLDLATGDVRHEVPVTTLSPTGRVVTYNATHLEMAGDRLRMYAVPDDSDEPGESTLLVLETVL